MAVRGLTRFARRYSAHPWASPCGANAGVVQNAPGVFVGQPAYCVRGLSNWLRQLSNPGRGFSSPVENIKKRARTFVQALISNMAVRGIDSLRSPWQPAYCVRGLSNWLRQLSNPGRGFSSPVENIKKRARTFVQALISNMAVRGFEPPIRCRIHTFRACSFSHSDTSPYCLPVVVGNGR